MKSVIYLCLHAFFHHDYSSSCADIILCFSFPLCLIRVISADITKFLFLSFDNCKDDGYDSYSSTDARMRTWVCIFVFCWEQCGFG